MKAPKNIDATSLLRYIVWLVLFCGVSTAVLAQTKPRTIVTTDGELDDVDSFIRMLLYTNEYKVEGLIISSSQWHYKGDGKGTKFISEMDMTKKLYGERTELRWPGEQWIYDLVDAYAKVYPKLKQHASFPTPTYLKSRIRIGNIDFEGAMDKDTEGSDFIKAKLLDNDLSPLYLQVWGGTNTIARALKSIETSYKNTPQWTKIYEKVCRKVILYAILDQDATYRKYIAVAWPDIKIYYNTKQFGCFAYFWQKTVPTDYHPYLEGKFMGNNVILNHGPLLAYYYSYGDGNPPKGELEDIYSDPAVIKNNMWGSFSKYDFISEGDSPAFLHLIDLGLDNLQNPHYGGWGGRLVQSTSQPNRWEDGEAAADLNPFTQKMDSAYPQARWIPAIQNDFAARADWCIKNFKDANHAPTVKLAMAKTVKAKANEIVRLLGSASDIDGHALQYRWWQYQEVGTYKGTVTISKADSKTAHLQMPADIKPGESIHLIFEVNDTGTPQLTRYKRVIITCQP